MNKDDVKKLDEIATEEAAETQELTSDDLDNVNGGGYGLRKLKKRWQEAIRKATNEEG